MDDKNISTQEKKAPLEVKIIAIISVLFGFFPAILAIIELFQATSDERGWMFMIGAPLLLLFLIVAVCIIFITTMLWKGKNWARIILIIFFVIQLSLYLWFCIALSLDYSSSSFLKEHILTYVIPIVTNIVLSSSAIFYLMFNKKVKEFFKKQIV